MKILFCFIAVLATCNAQCTLSNNWTPQTIFDRAGQADYVVDVKVVEIMPATAGSTLFPVRFDLICGMRASGSPPPATFVVDGFGPRPAGCPYRDVVMDQDYVLFLSAPDSNNVFSLLEVNQQSAVLDESEEVFQALGNLVVDNCVTNGCEQKGPGWVAKEEQERAKDADIVVKATVDFIKYYEENDNQYMAMCTLKCLMNEPYNLLNFNKQFNVTALGAFSGVCVEHHVTAGKDYVMFLQRHFPIFPLPGQTVPPSIMDNYVLTPQEVNLQEATFEFTQEIELKFVDYLATCGGAKELMFLPLLGLCLLISVFDQF